MGNDSLVLGGAIELLNGGVKSTNPLCAGAMFRLQPGADPGAPQPTADYVASLILDGERPFGRRSSNRAVKLPIWITGPTRAIVAAAREVLQTVIDQDYWTITWTRDPTSNAGGVALPMILDAFRANPTTNTFNTLLEKQGYGQQVVVTIPALPYGRSDVMIQVPFQSPAPAPNAPPAPPAPVVLDNFSTISSTQCFQSTQCVVGPFSACFDPDLFGDLGGQQTPFVYSSTFTTPLNLTSMTSLQVHMGMGSRYYTSLEYRGKTSVGVYVTLTDTTGNTLNFSRSNLRLPVSPIYGAPTFSRVTIPIPQQNTGSFNFASVKSYVLTTVNRQFPVPRLGWCVCYLDNLTAYPGSQTINPVTRGAVYTMYGVQGTARTPMALQFQQPPTAGTPTTLTATGAGTYTVPAGTAYLKVECIGAGGAGATQTVSGQGPGGGGGEYAAEQVFPAQPGQVIPLNIGAGGTPGASPVNGQPTVFGPAPGASLVVQANGGISAAENGTAGAIGGSGSTNSTHYPGGTGRTPTGGFGGGGGSSAGSGGPGNSPIGSASSTFTSSGSFTIPAGAGPVTISLWGPGGGGGGGFYGAGGGGGEFVQFTLNLAPGTYPFTIGGAGSAGSSGNNGGNGGTTSITIGGTTYQANGGQGGGSGWGSSGGQGGQGSSSPGEQPGGSGGSGYPYSGGGGSSASAAGSGNNGNHYGGAGIAPTGGGNGGNGSGSGSGSGSAGQSPGGGGGGAQQSGFSGGAGAHGQLSVTYSAAGAPTASGGVAPTEGGNGGAGGATANTAGSNGSNPGGGGGGGNSSGSTEAGGNGGNGQIIITPYASAAFKNLIVHRPPLGVPRSWQPLVSVGGGLDAPDGTHQYQLTPPAPTVLQDWGFEDGTVDGWGGAANAGSAAVSNYTGWANTGTHSLLLTAGSGVTGFWQMFSPAQPVSAGQWLNVTAVVKNPNATTVLNQVALGFNWYGTAGFISATGGPVSAIAAGAVRSMNFAAQAPPGATTAIVTITDGEAVASGTLMAADDIILSGAVNIAYGGTYTFYLVNASWNGSGSRNLFITVTQQEYAGGPSYPVSTTPISFTPSQITNGVVTVGVLTLPIKKIPADNTQAIFTVSVTDSNTSDRYYDLIALDTQGQTVVINEPTSGYITYYIDTPSPNVDLGDHSGSSNGRSAAISVLDNSIVTGPLYLEPADGDNLMFAYSADAQAPNIDAAYNSAWWFDRYQ